VDWSRAKTGMIIAFLTLNLFLLWQVYSHVAGEQRYGSAIPPSEVKRVLGELERHGVTVKARVPREEAGLPVLVVRQAEMTETDLAHLILGSDHMLVAKYFGLNIYQAPAGVLGVWIDGRRFYALERAPIFSATGHPPGLVAAFTARREAARFLASFSVPMDALRFDYVVRSGKREHTAVFYQEFEGVPLFGAGAAVRLQPGEPQALLWHLVRVIAVRQPGRLAIPATEALLRAAAAGYLPHGARVLRLELGYHAEPMDAVEWEALPVWRLLLADGRQVLVNAFTGEVEPVDLQLVTPR